MREPLLVEPIPPTVINGHELIEVGNRRWCLCCDLFQHKPNARIAWRNDLRPCPRNTPYASSELPSPNPTEDRT